MYYRIQKTPTYIFRQQFTQMVTLFQVQIVIRNSDSVQELLLSLSASSQILIWITFIIINITIQ